MSRLRSPGIWVRGLVIACAGVALHAAAMAQAVPATPEQLTATTAANPYREWAPGLLARSRLAPTRSGALQIEVMDLMVGPSMVSAPFLLPGAAVIEVRSGAGTLSGNGEGRRVSMGQVEGFDDSTSLQFTNNRADEPLILRATLVRGALR